MNDLNSILIEGILNNDPIDISMNEHNFICQFDITTCKEIKINDIYEKEYSFFKVIVENSKMAEICLENLLKKRGVRIVGRLKTRVNPKYDVLDTFIIAEHIEFKQ